ncbi:HAMP domain-containing histidine kinase [Gloeocapsopsis crepidinum LEGE 06123]|uniref:histidine kinase n=1 Tax=Gloeocapsopsis crepidinum LEGE 06123 TaxID=588587 RepID=A0ABR9UWS2_9CHRO|nr:HAMP domain-containing sensor histidine kinase [Gloeocapsopsis crepidinum]MBE9192752.1 HAMP domain-containing histidine kinase [Gloeocapsopsis crepidinum LEGE 06123]
MFDFSQILLKKSDTIIENWVADVRQDRQIETTEGMCYAAIRNHVPYVLQAMATVLSKTADDDIHTLVEASLVHGIHRAEEGFDPLEIAREYRLLRRAIFSALEPDLQQVSSTEVIRVFRLVDAVVDDAIARCFQSYVDERLRELQQLQSQLTLHNQELTRLIRANQENFSHLAHELKNPLTSIIGYSDLFIRLQNKTEVKDNYKNIEHIERVLRNGRHLLRLINDALEISRYEAGKMRLHPEPTDVCAAIQDVLDMLQPMAQVKNLQIATDLAEAPPKVITDALRFQQIVTNLVSNAIRYTSSGSVVVKCYSLEDKWAIAVSDTGIGIAPEEQTRIFEPYYRIGDTPKSHLPDSTGLGLAIVSRLVKLLQGEINFVSEVGVGSTFTVILPIEVIRG